MKKMILLRGLPGSGKSTFAKSIGDTITGIIEADMYFVDNEGNYNFDVTKLHEAHKWCKETVEKWMGPHGLDDIIISNTFTQEWEMNPYLELAEKYGYVVFSLVVENRHNGKNIHGVPDEKLEQMKNRFELKLI
jgi:predicted kinase